MNWVKVSDSLGWTEGHSGKGYLLHDGTIKTWNVDPYHPEDQHQAWERNHELSPIALNFDIDPDGGVVTEEPTIKVEQIVNADSRLYDAGQRETFEDSWNLENFEPKEKPDGKPDINFIMSGVEDWEPETQAMFECPRCHRQALDDIGHCHGCGYVIPYDGVEQMQGGDIGDPVPGWKAGLDDDDVYRGWLGEPHFGGWVKHPPHTNRFTGLPCDCPWGQPKHWHKTAGVNKRRLLKAPDKAYRTPQGKAFQRYIKTLPEEYDALIPYLGARFKKGDIRYTPPASEPGSPAPRLEFLNGSAYDYPGRDYRRPAELMPSWEPVLRHIPQWQQWLEARQHPTRRGVNILDPSLTPELLQNKVDEHQADLRERQKKERWLNNYARYAQPMHVFGPEAGKHKGWQVVPLDAEQAEGDSAALGHCIGSDEQPYRHNIAIGNIKAYSLRDKQGYPHVSWHVNPSGDSIGHMQGASGDAKPEYRELISMFNKERGLPDDESYGEEPLEPEYDANIELPNPGDVEDYLNQYHDQADIWELAQQHGEVGEDTEIYRGTPDWESIASDWLHGGGNSESNELFQTLKDMGHSTEFAHALEEAADLSDPDDRRAISYWNSEGAGQYSYIDIPMPEATEASEYHGLVDEGEDFETDWDKVAQDYLLNHEYYSGRGRTYPSNPSTTPTGYDRFHRALEERMERPEMVDALRANVNWEDPDHQQAIEHWNRGNPQHNIYPEQELPSPLPGQTQWDWPNDLLASPTGLGPNYNWNSVPYAVSNDSQYIPPGGYTSSWHFADYQGWTNWDTWNTALMMDNDQPLYTAVRKLVERGGGPEQIRDWALRKVIGPHNKQAIEDAQDWNSIPQDERVDHRFEDLKAKNPQAADIVDGLGFGADVDDDEPTLIDPELVNWDEIHQGLVDEAGENADYDRQMQEAKDQGIGWATNHDEGTNRMRDALYRYHGAEPEAGIGDPKGYNNIRLNVPGEQFKQMSGPHWPENYMSQEGRGKAWDLRRQQGRSNYDDIDWTHPEFQSIADADPDIQGIMQNGYSQSLSDLTWSTITAIRNGQPHPYIEQMQQALQQRGYTPEQISQYTQQLWEWDPKLEKSIPINREPPVQQWQDQSVDRPGTTTFPQEWTSKVADAANILAPATELREWLADLGGAEPISPHHITEDDFISAPRPSTADDLPYFPPANVPKEYKTADAPITQADATNDPLGKSPAIEPSPHGDPDYLEETNCPHCLQRHRPDEPCPNSSVNQYRQQERSWYNRDPNSTHGPAGPDGLHDQQMDLGSRMGAAPVMYHVAPTVDRERIQQHGLQPSDPAQNWTTFREGDEHPEGVYAFTDRDRANAFRTMLEFRRGQPHDIWAFEAPEGGQEDPDLGSSSRYLTSPVQPRLVEGPEHREDMPEYMQPQYVRPDDPWKRGPYPLAPDEGRGRPYPQNEPEQWDQRVGASDQRYYHAAPGGRPVIQEGLRAHEPEVTQANSPWDWADPDVPAELHPPGNYLWSDPERAWDYATDEGFLDPEVYEVAATGLPVHPDPDDIHRGEGSVYIPAHIGPERLRPLPRQASNPRPDDPQGGWEDDGGKLAAMTLPQQQRQWDELNQTHPNTSEMVDQFPSGWSIQRPIAQDDVRRVGLHMRNCWQGGGNSSWADRWNPHVLHDELGLPRVAFLLPNIPTRFDIEDGGRDIREPWGHHNNPPDPEAANLLTDWAERNNYTINSRDPDGWLDDIDTGTYQTGDRVASWDPLVCEHCNSPMTEPQLSVTGDYMNTCTNCRSTRMVPKNHPLLQQHLQQQEHLPYPELLNEVQKPYQPWVVSRALRKLRSFLKRSYDHEKSLIDTATTLADSGSDIEEAASWLESALTQSGRPPQEAQLIADEVFMRRGSVGPGT